MKDKGNDGRGNTTDRDNWETPQWLFDKLYGQYEFDMDLCANKKNKKCVLWTNRIERVPNEIDDSKIMKFWMNPPFSKAKEMFKHFFRIANRGVAIYRADNMETKVWQEIILKKADWIFIPKGRIAYQYNPDLRKGKGTRFPSALIGIGIKPIKNLEGVTLYLKELKK